MSLEPIACPDSGCKGWLVVQNFPWVACAWCRRLYWLPADFPPITRESPAPDDQDGISP